jgi:quercetin 2,3-dioxygenase
MISSARPSSDGGIVRRRRDVIEASAGSDGGRFLLAAARPLGEPIARHGPFVMNTRAEIEQTRQDLRTGRFIRNDPRDA